MSRNDPTPVGLDSIKRLAKTIKRKQLFPHHQALDLAAKEAGFNNFKHAKNHLAKRSQEAQLFTSDLFHTITLVIAWQRHRWGKIEYETRKVVLSLSQDHTISQFADDQIVCLSPGENTTELLRTIARSKRAANHYLHKKFSLLCALYPDHVIPTPHAPAQIIDFSHRYEQPCAQRPKKSGTRSTRTSPPGGCV